MCPQTPTYIWSGALTHQKSLFLSTITECWVLKNSNIHFLLSRLGFPDSSVDKESACNAGDPNLIPGSGRFPCGTTGKESACNVGDLSLIPSLERSPGEGKGYPLQYSGLENSMDCIEHGVAKSWTWLSNFHFCFSLSRFSRTLALSVFKKKKK